MTEGISISPLLTKKERYEALIGNAEALISGENDVIANLANISALLKQGMNFFWVGFYLVKNEQLVLGPFQGPVACTRIDYGKGVCGAAWKNGKVILVPDVDKFPGHIACSSLSKSEIVLPAFKNGKVALVLDADSDKSNDFDETDQHGLQKIIALVEKII